MTDGELLKAYSESASEEAFGQLTRQYINLVYSAALRQIGNHAGAEEVTQVVFILLARKAATLDPKTILPAWLLRTTRFTALNYRQRESRRNQREQHAFCMNQPGQASEESPWDQIAPFLDDALDQLNERDRTALILRFFQNKSVKDVGLSLGIEPAAAGKRIGRAVEKIRARLIRRGLILSSAGLIAGLGSQAVQAAPAGMTATITAGALGASSSATSSLASTTLNWIAAAKIKASVVAWGSLLVTGIGTGVVAFQILQNAQTPQPPWAGTRFRLPAGNQIPRVALGRWHGTILAPDGTLWTWGQNTDGWPVLGLGGITNQTKLRSLETDRHYRTLASSEHHNLAIRADGTLWGWGENIHGQVGDGSSGRGNAERETPVESAPGQDWKDVAAGGSHSLALKTDGSLWAWGNNWAGQLGINRNLREVTEATQVGRDHDWNRIWTGILESVAQKTDGSLWYWGGNPNPLVPQSGAGSSNLFAPVLMSSETNWTSVGFGAWTVLATKSDGSLWAWGRKAHRYTGITNLADDATPQPVGTNRDWMEISGGGWFYHVLKRKDGSLWEMKPDPDREDREGAPPPTSRIDVPGKIMAFTAGSGLPCGVAITDQGEVWTWGKVLGAPTGGNRALQALSRMANRIGWRLEWGETQPLSLEKPWRLPLED